MDRSKSTRKIHREEAEARDKAYASLTVQQKLAKLDLDGSNKQRAKLQKLIDAKKKD